MLFQPGDLASFLHKEVNLAEADVAERVVWGWLRPVLGLTDRPSPVPDEVFSWAVELGAIAHENPMGLSVKQIGPFRYDYSEERRTEILAEVSGYAASVGGVSMAAPQGSFPLAVAWPDPPRVRW